MIFKDADNHVSGNERSSEASVTKNPYYPYNQEWFGHDEEDTPDLVEDWLIGSPYLPGLHNGQNATMFTLDEVPIIVLLLAHANDDVFEKEDSSSFWSPHAFFRHIWIFGLKN